MSSIATCPQCAAQLALPEAASESDYAQCPECMAEFSVAEADQRPLATAQLVEKLPEPPPAIEPEIHPEPIVYPEPTAEVEHNADSETMILPDPVELPDSEAPESLETPEVAERVSLDDLEPPVSSNAETIVSDSSDASDWEARICSAIDANSPEASPTEEPDETPAVAPAANLLDSSPQFDFQMDPPDETPIEHEPVSPEELTKTAEWFESTSNENVDNLEVPEPAMEAAAETIVAEPQEVVAPVAEEPSPGKQRRKKNSLVRLAAVFTVFAVLGTVLGQYALLWLRGPSADYLGLAKVMPSSVMPAATSQLLAPQISAGEQLAGAQPEPTGDGAEPPAEELLADASSKKENPVAELLRDDAVTPATAELPVEPVKQALSLLPTTNTTPTEFNNLLAEAQQGVPGFLVGEITSPEDKRTKGQAYMAFCRLAERWDFADVASVALDDAGAKHLFEQLASNATGRRALAYIGQRWWQHDKRPHQGCVVVGRVLSATEQGSVTLYELALENSDAGIVVPIVTANSNFQTGDSVAVVGTIVRNPQQVVSQLSLDLPQAVVARHLFGL